MVGDHLHPILLGNHSDRDGPDWWFEVTRGSWVRHEMMNPTGIVLDVNGDQALVNWEGWKRNISMEIAELEEIEPVERTESLCLAPPCVAEDVRLDGRHA